MTIYEYVQTLNSIGESEIVKLSTTSPGSEHSTAGRRAHIYNAQSFITGRRLVERKMFQPNLSYEKSTEQENNQQKIINII